LLHLGMRILSTTALTCITHWTFTGTFFLTHITLIK
jgi:hypothetical protein